MLVLNCNFFLECWFEPCSSWTMAYCHSSCHIWHRFSRFCCNSGFNECLRTQIEALLNHFLGISCVAALRIICSGHTPHSINFCKDLFIYKKLFLQLSITAQIDSTIFVVFLTYFVIPLSLRIATGLSVVLTLFHLIVATSVSFSTSGEVLARQVCMCV